jgi:hypothetical protein
MKSDSREYRNFGLTVGGVLLAFGCWWLFRGKFEGVAPAFVSAGAILIVAAAIAPRFLALPYRLWMALAEGLSFVMTRVILFAVFSLVITPIGLARRLTGADPLRRRGRTGPDSGAWQPYPARHRDPRHYERTF